MSLLVVPSTFSLMTTIHNPAYKHNFPGGGNRRQHTGVLYFMGDKVNKQTNARVFPHAVCECDLNRIGFTYLNIINNNKMKR